MKQTRFNAGKRRVEQIVTLILVLIQLVFWGWAVGDNVYHDQWGSVFGGALVFLLFAAYGLALTGLIDPYCQSRGCSTSRDRRCWRCRGHFGVHRSQDGLYRWKD